MANSPDGSTLRPGSGGSLTTSAGTWTFSPTVTGSAGFGIVLTPTGMSTGSVVGFGDLLLVANSGTLYNYAPRISTWQLWNGTNFAGTSGPNVSLLNLPLELRENHGASSMFLPMPSDTNGALNSSLTVSVTSVPASSFGTVLNGATVVSAGTVLTPAELAALQFLPGHDATGSSSFGYSISDPGVSVPIPSEPIILISTPPNVTSAYLVASSTAPTPIPVPAPTDINYSASQITATITGLPSNGVVLLTSGGATRPVSVGQTLDVNELTSGLSFELTSGASQASVLWYSVTDPSSGWALGHVSLVPELLTTPAAVTVAPNAGPSPIDIAAPATIQSTGPNQSYNYYPPSALAVRIAELPSNGTVLLVSGGTTTPVSAGEVLTVAELTDTFSNGALVSGLAFQPTSGAVNETSTLTYIVTDPSGASGAGSATVTIGAANGLWQDPVSATGSTGVDILPSVPQPNTIGSGIVGLDLQNTGGSAEPGGYVTFGQVFRDGDVSSGTALTAHVVSGGMISGGAIPVQMNVETTYADGSVEHAILTISAPPVAAGGTVDLLLANGGSTSPALTAQQVANLLSASGDVTVATSFYTPETVSIGGTPQAGDVLNLTFTPTSGSPIAVSYSTPSSPTTSGDAAGLMAVLQNNAPLTLAGFSFAVSGSVLSIGVPPNNGSSPAWTVSGSVAGSSPTTTLTIAGGTVTGSAGVSAYAALESAISGGTVSQNLWMSGPQVSEYVVSTFVDGGRLEVEFDIRAYQNGATSTNVIFSTAQTNIGITASGGWTTGTNTITMTQNNPGTISAGMSVYDASSGRQVGTVASWSAGSPTLTLSANAAAASLGGGDLLFFGVTGAAAPAVAPNVDYNAAISRGGITAYSASDISQYPFSEWNYRVNSPQIINPNVQYDVQYLEATGAIDSYDTSLGVSAAAIQGNNVGSGTLPPLDPTPQRGDFYNVTRYMGSTGDRQDIGTQPNWTVQWLLSQDATAQQTMMTDAGAAGSAPWNIIDAATGQPVNLETYNALFDTNLPAAGNAAQLGSNDGFAHRSSDGDAWGLDAAHQPDLNYVPYLVSGNPYQLQLLQDQANFSIDSVAGYGRTFDTTNTAPMGVGASFVNVPGANSGTDNLSNGNQVRAMAWELREVAEAAYLTPNTGPEAALKLYYTNELNKAMNGLVQEYITDNINGQFGALNGMIEGSTGPVGSEPGIGPYMEFYFATTLAEVASLNIPQASANAVKMLKYMNNFLSGLFTNGPNGFNPLDGTAYVFTLYDPATGAPFTTWSQAFAGNLNPNWSNGAPGVAANPTSIINFNNSTRGGYAEIAAAGLAGEVTYTELPQAMQAYGFVVSQIAYAFNSEGGGSFSDGSGATLAQAYQNYPLFDITPRLPDGRYLEFDQMQFAFPTSGVVSSLTGASGVDSLLASVGGGTATLFGNSAAGGVDLIYGGTGSNTLITGAGNDYLFGGNNSAGVGTSDTVHNTFVIANNVTSAGRRTTIVNFNPANDHLAAFTNIDSSGVFSSAALQRLVSSNSVISGGNMVIQLDPGGPSDTVVLIGVTDSAAVISGIQTFGNIPPFISAGSAATAIPPTELANGTVVLSGGELFVQMGNGTIGARNVILSGGTETIDAGGTAIDTGILSGGSEIDGGAASGTIVSGGAEIVSAGGVANGTTIDAGGSQSLIGGQATGTIVKNGGNETVGAGGTAANTAVAAGGGQIVSGSGADATNTAVAAGGSQSVGAGGAANGSTVAGTQNVLAGGTASGGSVTGTEKVQAGGTANNVTIAGQQLVSGTGAIANNTTVTAGGSQSVAAGGTASGGTVTGSETVLAGGAADFVKIAGQQLVSGAGAVANNTTVSAGGSQAVAAGGTASSGTVTGTETVLAGGTANAMTIVGQQLVSGAGASATDTGVAVGGSQSVVAGATASGGFVVGTQNVLAGGTAIGVGIIGTQNVLAGGTASGGTVTGTENVQAGGTADAVTIEGRQLVSGAGAVANNTTVSAGGIQSISAGGTASGGTIAGTQSVLAGGTARGGTIVGSETVQAGGTADAMTIVGQQFVSGAGAVANNTTVLFSGSQSVGAGGTASGGTVSGIQTVLAGGAAIGGTISGNQSVQAGGTADLVTIAGQQLVSGAGAIATNTTIALGGSQLISAGGTANGGMVLGQQFVLSGGTASGGIIDGQQSVLAGGTASGGTVSGVEVVQAGGTANSVTIEGLQVVSGAGASATGTTVASGGIQSISAGGTASGGTVTGTEYVQAGGAANAVTIAGRQLVSGAAASATGTTVSAGGSQSVSAGGTASGGTIAGTQSVLGGGTAAGATIAGGGSQTISGGAATGTTVLTGGSQAVLAGAAIGTVVESGGSELVSGGTTTATNLASGGSETVFTGAVASGTVVVGGASLILSGGTAVGTVYGSGFSATLTSGTLIDPVISGGTLTVSGAAMTVSNPVVSNGGELIVSSGGTVSNPVVGGGTLTLTQGAVISGDVTFASGTSATLVVSGAVSGTGATLLTAGGTVISSFAPGNTIDLSGLPLAGLSLSSTMSNGLFDLDVISGGTIVDVLAFSQPPAPNETFVLFNDVGIGLVGFVNSATLNATTDSPPATISSGLLLFSDPTESDPTKITYTVSSLPHDGTLLFHGSAAVSGSTFTQADINSGGVTYRETAEVASTGGLQDSFAFTLADDHGVTTPEQTFNIAVTDTTAPTVGANGTLQVPIGGSAVISAGVLSAGDPDNTAGEVTYTVLSGPADGTILDNGQTVTSFTQADIDNGAVQYRENGAAVSSDGFTFAVSDPSGNQTAASFNVAVIDPTPPTIGADNILHVSVGGSAVIAAGALSAGDPDNTAGQLTYTVLAGPANGTIRDRGVAVTSFTQADINNGAVQYRENGAAAGSDSFSFRVSDPAGNAAPGSFSIAVSPANPVSPPSTAAVVAWTDPTTGDTGYWSFANGALVGFHDLAAGDRNYTAVAVGNFDGSGSSEILWQDETTGDTGYWTVSNGAVAGFHDLGQADPNYSVVGVGAFAGSGQDKALWENAATGDTGYWMTDGNGNVTGFHTLGNADSRYTVVGVGNFDGSGRSEVLWENRATGDTGYWTIDSGGTVTGFVDLGTGGSGYGVVGVGDFDGSGRDEVLWENQATGDTGYWMTSSGGGAVTGFHDFGFGDVAYTVVGTADYDGSGHAGVLWENEATGDSGYWATNVAGQVTAFHDLGQTDAHYHVIPA